MQPSPDPHESGSGRGTPTRTRPGSSGKADQLAEKISDEFLTCKICMQTYNNPKCLTCMHTFCEDCIERHASAEASYKKYSDYREFTCPLCRKRTQLPLGGARKLPDNFLLSSLNEIVKMQKPSKMPYCDICKMVAKRMKEATAKCLDCSKLLCPACVDQHRETKITKNHSVFDVEIEKDIQCGAHGEEAVRFYCEPCERCVCVLCTFAEHRGHEISQFSDAVGRYKANIGVLLQSCKDKLARYERQMESVGKCENVTRQAEEKIREVAAEMIGQIRAREKQLLEELQNVYGKDAMALIDRKSDLQATLDGLKSTCSLTELILQGKGVELLLLKKDVSDKLATLSKGPIEHLPATIGKTVKFVPGIVDLGYLHDMDRPLLSRQRYRRALTSSFDYRSPTDEPCPFWFAVNAPNEVFNAASGGESTIAAETQTVQSGGNRADAEAMTDWSFKNISPKCEQSVQVNESELGRRGGGDGAAAARKNLSGPALSADETSYGSVAAVHYESGADGVITRRRRRADRTRTAHLENADYKYTSEAAETDGDGEAARTARRADAASRNARRFHLLDTARLRRYKSFEDDSQASNPN